jgi:hypothetical protein
MYCYIHKNIINVYGGKMSIATNVIFDKSDEKDRHLISRDKYNWIYLVGPKHNTIEQIVALKDNKLYYTSMKSLVIELFEKRLNKSTHVLGTQEIVKAVNMAYQDVVEVAIGVQTATKHLITRGDRCEECNKEL